MSEKKNYTYISAIMFILGGSISFAAGFIIPTSKLPVYLLLVILGITLFIKCPSMMQTVVFGLLAFSEFMWLIDYIPYIWHNLNWIMWTIVYVIRLALYAYLAYACFKLSREIPVRFIRSSVWFLPIALLVVATVVSEITSIIRAVEYVAWYNAEGYLDSDARYDQTEMIISGTVWAIRTVLCTSGLLLVCRRLKNTSEQIKNELNNMLLRK